jgi:hypothetical protein
MDMLRTIRHEFNQRFDGLESRIKNLNVEIPEEQIRRHIGMWWGQHGFYTQEADVSQIARTLLPGPIDDTQTMMKVRDCERASQAPSRLRACKGLISVGRGNCRSRLRSPTR